MFGVGVSRQAAGLASTLAVLRAEGRLDDVDEALVALAEGLAEAVDGDPLNAALWREYRAAVGALKEAGSVGQDDETAAFIVSVRTPLGDTKKS